MRILMIARCPPTPLFLGDRLIVYHLGEALAARGHTIDLIALDDRLDLAGAQFPTPFFRRLTRIPDTPRSPLFLLNRLIRFWMGKHEPGHFASSEMVMAIRAHLDHENYDLVHVIGGISVYEYAPLFGYLPTLITPYESATSYLKSAVAAETNGLHRLGIRMAQFITSRFERFMYTSYRRVVVLTESDRAQLQAINPALPLEVIPNGIDSAYFQPQTIVQREANSIVFIGNYEYAPNVEAAQRLAREIFPAVRARIPDARLQLVGNLPADDSLSELQGESIEVIGRVPDVRDALARAAIFVSPLTVGAGMKNKILEAMAMGCPVIATPLSMDGIDVIDGEHVIIAEPKDMPEHIIALFADPAYAARLGANAAARVRSRYTWEAVAAGYERLYGEITSPH